MATIESFGGGKLPSPAARSEYQEVHCRQCGESRLRFNTVTLPSFPFDSPFGVCGPGGRLKGLECNVLERCIWFFQLPLCVAISTVISSFKLFN
jgi:hypothetical protein